MHRVHCESKKCSYKLLWCWSANPRRVPFAGRLLPEGMAVLMINDVSCFSPACLCLLFSAFVSTVSYSVLGQLSDAHWPNSASPCPSSLGRGNLGKAIPLHCSCSPAAAQGFSGGTAVTAAEAVTQFNNLLVSELQITISKEQNSESSFCTASFPKLAFFTCVNNYKDSED